MEFEKQIPRRVLRNANGILPRTPSAPFALTVKFCLLNFQGLYLKASTTGGIFSYSAGPNLGLAEKLKNSSLSAGLEIQALEV